MTLTKIRCLTFGCFAFLLASSALPPAGRASTILFSSVSAEPHNHVSRWFSHTEGNGQSLPDKRVGNEVFYQLFIDRFANGNPRNDCLYDGRFCDTLQQDWYRYWGGDIAGVIDRMDYLKDLGVTRLWLTPIFENQQVKVATRKHGRDVEVTSYHGYWFRDWFQLNPMFTDQGKRDFAIVDDLVAAGEPEIKVVLDTVANHTSPAILMQSSLDWLNQIEPLSTSDGVRRSHRGALFKNGEYLTSYDEDEQQRPGVEKRFHHYSVISDYNNIFQVENYSLDGLADIDQQSPFMVNYLREAHQFWLDRFPGLAGYRMDTIKHVNQSYWRQFNSDLLVGNPDLEVIGEYFSAGPNNTASHAYYKQTNMSMFDFDFRYAVENVFLRNRPMTEFTKLWDKDVALIDARAMLTFVDNHDVPRLRGLGMTYQAMRQALALLFASRGIPCLYYGIEQDLFTPNDPGDPFNRPMMKSFDENHELFRMVQTLAGLRKRNLALRYGSTHVVHESDNILAFERVNGDQKVFFATSKNTPPNGGSDNFEMQNLTLPNGSYRDVLSGKEYQVRSGRILVSLKKGDVIVLSTI